jgi:N-acetylglucosamine kinase-like BadF-type ATPase
MTRDTAEAWVFGIDGGGTSSRLRAETLSGTTLYEGGAGSTNMNSNSRDSVTGTLVSLLHGAFTSGLAPQACKAGFIGSAGVDSEAGKKTMIDALGQAFGRAAAGDAHIGAIRPVLGAGNDAEPALVGALDDTEGYLLIAGTGSIAYARADSGASVRAGGWGHFLGDEGSAFWVAFQGIVRGLRSSEGRDTPTTVLEAALDHFGLADPEALIPFVYADFDKTRIASFAPRVAAIAANGDPLARAILGQAAAELAALVVSVHARLGSIIERSRLALYGGLLEKNAELRSAVADLITQAVPGMVIVKPAGDAQAGACLLARSMVRP